MLDDHWLHAHLARTERVTPALRPWWDLFSFYVDAPSTRFLRDIGVAPWWSDEAVRIRFLRPLTSALHAADELVPGAPPAFAHVHSIALYAAVVWAAVRLFRRVAPGRASAAIASALFVVASSHAVPLAWVSNRNALVATFVALLGIRAHLRAIERGGAALAAVASLLLAVALLAGEVALGALGFVLAAELTLASDALRARAVRLTPYAAVLLAWHAAYRALGFGASGSGMYLDPGADPLAWTAEAPLRFATLAGSAFGGAPADLWFAAPAHARAGVAVGLGVLGAAVVAFSATLLKRERAARFFLVGALLACVPACGTFPSVRLLLLASVGATGFLGMAIVDGWRTGVRSRRAPALILAILHGPLALIQFAASAASLPLLEGRLARASASLDALALGSARCVVYAHAPMLLNGYFGLHRDAAGLPNPAYGITLGASERPLVVGAEGSALVLEAPEGFYGPGDIGTLTRSLDRPFEAGARIDHPCGQLRIDAVDARGVPTRARFDLAGPTPILRWVDARLVPVDVPRSGEPLRSARAPPM